MENRNAYNNAKIPDGIYYSAEHDNFYCADMRKGQGELFYTKWRSRSDEFPRTGAADPEQNAS